MITTLPQGDTQPKGLLRRNNEYDILENAYNPLKRRHIHAQE
jgi:hypothetical protein